MTPFVTTLVEPYLKYMNNSLVDYGRPCGLVALTLVSVRSTFICLPFSYSVKWHSLSVLSMHSKQMGLSRILALSILNTKLFLQNILKVSIPSRTGMNFIMLAILFKITGLVQRNRMVLSWTSRRPILADVRSILAAVPLNIRFRTLRSSLIYPIIRYKQW